MTESEYTNEQLIDFMYDVMDWRDVVDHPMIYAVIKELKERHAYRAIGTVEELQKMKDDYAEAITDWRQYKKIGTIERFRELTEKAEPKKPIRMDLCTCPSCGTHNEVFKKRRNTVTYDIVHCWHCGQAVEIKRD